MRSQIKWLILATIAVVVMSACSSSSKTSAGTSAPANGGSTTSPNGSPLLFGIISSDTGPSGADNDTPTTAKDWEAYVNSHGGIGGHPVRVIEENDNDNAATALQDAQDLVQNKHVIAIGDASQTDSSFEKFVDSAKVPVISLNKAGGLFTYVTDPNFFTNGSSVLTSIWALTKVAALSGNTKFAELYCSEIAACAESIPLIKADAATVGVTVAYTASYSASSPDYTAECLAAEQKGVNALVAGGADQTSNQRVYDDCAKQGYHPLAIAGLGNLGPAAATDPDIPIIWGQVPTLPWFVTAGSAMTTFHSVMGGYLPHATSAADVAADWVGLQLFAAAAANVGATPTSQNIYSGLYGLQGSTLGGLTSPLTFKQGSPNPGNCFFVYEIDHGVYSTPEGTNPVCVTK